MNWYYRNKQCEAIGPLSETAVRELHQCGVISDETLVLREDSSEWSRYAELVAPHGEVSSTSVETTELKKFHCIHCGQRIAADPSQIGMSTECPTCGGEVVVPGEHSSMATESSKEPGTARPDGELSTADCLKTLLAKAKEKFPDKESRERLLAQAKQVAQKTKERIGESQISHKITDQSKELAAKLDSSALPDTKDLSIRSAVPLFVCCLGFGWLGSVILPSRYFVADGVIGTLFPVTLLAFPALALSLLAILLFLRPSSIKWPTLLGGLLFTMVVGIMILRGFQSLADSSGVIENRYYSKATPFIYAVKAIGWAGQNMGSGNLFQRLLTSIVHTGLCEEITKMLPVFLVVFLNKRKQNSPSLRGFLLLGFFSGLGFGIGEALLCYSPWNGNFSTGSNVIRWFTCVPLHGIYTVVDSAFLWLLIPRFRKAKSVGKAVGILVIAALVIAVVHGIYNTIGVSNMVLGIICDAGAIILMVIIVRRCTALKREGAELDAGATFPVSLPQWLTLDSSRAPRLSRFYALAALMLIGAMLFSMNETKAQAKLESLMGYPAPIATTEYKSTIPRRKASPGAYRLYMQGYNDPSQGEVAAIMANRFSDSEAKAAALIVLGAKDRLEGLPPRFELDRSIKDTE